MNRHYDIRDSVNEGSISHVPRIKFNLTATEAYRHPGTHYHEWMQRPGDRGIRYNLLPIWPYRFLRFWSSYRNICRPLTEKIRNTLLNVRFIELDYCGPERGGSPMDQSPISTNLDPYNGMTPKWKAVWLGNESSIEDFTSPSQFLALNQIDSTKTSIKIQMSSKPIQRQKNTNNPTSHHGIHDFWTFSYPGQHFGIQHVILPAHQAPPSMHLHLNVSDLSTPS